MKLTDAQLRALCIKRGIIHGCTHGSPVVGWTCHCGARGDCDVGQAMEAVATHMLKSGCRGPDLGPNASKLIASRLSTARLRSELKSRERRRG